MKTLRILTMAVAALIWAACGNEDFLENNPGNEAAKPVPMTFTADGPQTRTQLAAGNKVYWTEYDEIALWDGSEAYQKLMVDAESIDGSRATFSGPAIPGADYTAFYPLVAVESMDATSVTFNLPAEQTAVAGTFANQLAPSLAKATGGSTNLVFENLCALVKFTVPAEMAGEGTLTLVGGNATEALAGTLTCNTADGTLTATEAATRIALTGNFEAGKDYYFVVLPGTLADGFSLLYDDGKGKLYRKATGNSVTLQAGRILNLGELALTGFDKAVFKEIYPAGTPNADGTVTLNDADLSALAAMGTLDVSQKNLTSLGGIGYCTGLTSLTCWGNKLTELNLDGLTELTELYCDNNKLTSLDVSKLTKLTTLECYYNDLTVLNLGELSQLTDLRCHFNQLTSLDVSQLTQLKTLMCHQNKLTALDITRLPNLNTLYCGNQKDGRQLTLTLTAALETMWNDWWSSNSDNTNVTLDVK